MNTGQVLNVTLLADMMLGIILFITGYAITKQGFLIASFIGLFHIRTSVLKIASMVYSMLSVFCHFGLVLLAFLPLLTMAGAIAASFIKFKKKEPVQQEIQEQE